MTKTNRKPKKELKRKRDKTEENLVRIESLKKFKQKYFIYEAKTKLDKKGIYKDKDKVLGN